MTPMFIIVNISRFEMTDLRNICTEDKTKKMPNSMLSRSLIFFNTIFCMVLPRDNGVECRFFIGYVPIYTMYGLDFFFITPTIKRQKRLTIPKKGRKNDGLTGWFLYIYTKT